MGMDIHSFQDNSSNMEIDTHQGVQHVSAEDNRLSALKDAIGSTSKPSTTTKLSDVHATKMGAEIMEKAKAECSAAADKAIAKMYPHYKPGEPMDNNMTRDWYNACMDHFKSTVGPTLTTMRKQGTLSLEDHARTAFDVRHHARVHTRSLMEDKKGLAQIQKRDLSVYGNKDGPTFEHLMGKAQASGKSLEEAHNDIIRSSTSTNMVVNAYISVCKMTSNVSQVISSYLMPFQNINFLSETDLTGVV